MGKIFVFFIGTIFGSFINATAYRIVRKRDFVYDRSYCPVCNHKLSFMDMVPLISYLLKKGKCSYCKNKISIRYFITEFIGGINAIICWNLIEVNGVKILFFIIFNLLLLISLIDIEIKEINDFYQLLLLMAVIAIVSIKKWSLENCVGMAIISLPLLSLAIITKSIGGADVKLFFTLGLLTKTVGIVIIYLLTIIFASLFGIYRLKKEGNKKEEIALIPFIYLALLIYKIFEKQLVNCLMFYLT